MEFLHYINIGVQFLKQFWFKRYLPDLSSTSRVIVEDRVAGHRNTEISMRKVHESGSGVRDLVRTLIFYFFLFFFFCFIKVNNVLPQMCFKFLRDFHDRMCLHSNFSLTCHMVLVCSTCRIESLFGRKPAKLLPKFWKFVKKKPGMRHYPSTPLITNFTFYILI